MVEIFRNWRQYLVWGSIIFYKRFEKFQSYWELSQLYDLFEFSKSNLFK